MMQELMRTQDRAMSNLEVFSNLKFEKKTTSHAVKQIVHVKNI